MIGSSMKKTLMVHDAEVAGHDFVLQHGAGWYVNPITVVGDDDDGALRGGRTKGLSGLFGLHLKKMLTHADMAQVQIINNYEAEIAYRWELASISQPIILLISWFQTHQP